MSAVQADFLSDGDAGKEGQNVQNSGWLEVKKKSRSGSKSSTSKSNLPSKKSLELAGEGKVYSGQDGTEESKLAISCTDEHKPLSNPVVPKDSNSNNMDVKEVTDCHLSMKLIHTPKFKWGDLDDEDLTQSQLVDNRVEKQIEGSVEYHDTVLASGDSTIFLEGGKQSSAKELNDMQNEDSRQAIADFHQTPDINVSSATMQGEYLSHALRSIINEVEVSEVKEHAREALAEHTSQEVSHVRTDDCDTVPLHPGETCQSTDGIGSDVKICVNQQDASSECTTPLASGNLLAPAVSLEMSEQFEIVKTCATDVPTSVSSTFSECQQAIQGLVPGSDEGLCLPIERRQGEEFVNERSIDFSLATSMLMEKFEETKSGESKERFRQRLWCYLFENLNRAIDELYFMCELECDMEQIEEAILVLKEAGLDFIELKSRVDGFEKVKKNISASQTLLAGKPGGSLSGKVEHRRPHAIAWEVRRMACSPHRAEILSSSLEAFKKVQQETGQKSILRQPKRRDAARLIDLEQRCKEIPSKILPSSNLSSNTKEAVLKMEGKQDAMTNSNGVAYPVATDGEKTSLENLKGTNEFCQSNIMMHSTGSAYLKVALDVGSNTENVLRLGTSESKAAGEGSTERVAAMKGTTVYTHVERSNKTSEKRVSIVDRDREKIWSKNRSPLDAWKVKRNWEDILSSPLKSTNTTSRSPCTGRKSTERAKVLHDKLMSPEKKRKSPLEMKKEVDDKQARATRIRRELENERVQRLQRTTEKLNRVSEWQAVRSNKLREGMHARQQRGESRKEAHLAEIARRASDESSKVSEVRFITSLNEENKKLSLRQRLQDSELRRAERLQIIKIKQKEDVAREEAVLERRRLLEAERLHRIAETQRKKEEAKARREEERKAASAAREARAVEQVRKKEVRARAQQEEAELQAQKLREKLRKSELRRKVYLEQIRERAAMELREQASPSTRRPSSRDGQLRTTCNQGTNESDASIDKDIVLPKQGSGSKGTSAGPGVSVLKSVTMVLQHQALKKRVKRVRQRLMARKYEFIEPPTGTEGLGIAAPAAAGAARSKIGRWLQDIQRLQQARKAGTSGVGFIIGEMIKYFEGKEAELHAARQAGLLDFVATALPASHTSKPEASQTTLSLLRILKVLLALPANRSYFIARNLLPPLIPMLSTALENFSSLDSSSIAVAANASNLNGIVDKIPSHEKLDAIGEVLDSLLESVTLIMGHVCTDERQLLMKDDLSELLVSCEVIHRLRDLFSLFDRPQIEGAPFPAPVLLGLNLLQALTGTRGKLAGIPHEVQLNMKFELQESERPSVFCKDIGKDHAFSNIPSFPNSMVADAELTQLSSISGDSQREEPNHGFVEAIEVKVDEASEKVCEDLDETCAYVRFPIMDETQVLSVEVVNPDIPVNIPGEDKVGVSVVEASKIGNTTIKNSDALDQTTSFIHNPAGPSPIEMKTMESKSEKGQFQQSDATVNRSIRFLVSAIAETGLVGLPSLLTAVLLQTNPRSTPDQAAAVLPSNFEEVATGVLNVLNNLARMDLRLVQNLLAMPDLQMEFFHLVSFLLSHCTCKWSSSTDQVASLLLETLLLLGYFALLHPGNQAVLRWGKSPTILHKICDLPFAFFSDHLLIPVLIGTLLAVCYGSEQNRDVVRQELSMEMILSLLKSAKNELISQEDSTLEDFQGDFQSNPVTNQGLQMDAILEESEEEMQVVQGDEITHAKEEDKKVNEDFVGAETETDYNTQQQAALRSSIVRPIISDSIPSPIRKPKSSIPKVMTEGEISTKELSVGRSISGKGHASQARKAKGASASCGSESSAKIFSPNTGAASNKKMPYALPYSLQEGAARGVFSADSADNNGKLYLTSAFMLQNRFPTRLLDRAQEFFSVLL